MNLEQIFNNIKIEEPNKYWSFVLLHWCLFSISLFYLPKWLDGGTLFVVAHSKAAFITSYIFCTFASIVLLFLLLRINTYSVHIWSLVCAALIAALTLVLPEMYGVAIVYLSISLVVMRTGNGIWRYVLIALTAFTLALYSYYEQKYGKVTIYAIEAVAATNVKEAYYYILANISKKSIFSAILLTSIIWRIEQLIKLSGGKDTSLSWASLCLGTALGMVLSIHPLIERVNIVKKGFDNVKIRNSIKMTNSGDIGEIYRKSIKNVDIVFILGESSSRWHWNLYGYPANTNPELGAIRNELILFTDAVSVDSHTIPVLMEMMFRDVYSVGGSDAHSPISLFSLLKKGGRVKTQWISSQPRFAPDSLFNIEYNSGASSSNTVPDEQNLENLTKKLNVNDGNDSRLLVSQLFASHAPYRIMLPTMFREPILNLKLGKSFFGTAEDFSSDVMAYDSSVRYTDNIIAKTIKLAASKKKSTIVIFLPDHGEAPEEGTYHNMAQHSARHVEIPFLIYFNQSAKRTHAREYANLNSNKDKPFINSRIFELIAHLFGIESPTVFEERQSIASKEYSSQLRIIFPKSATPVFYDELERVDTKDYLERTRLNLKALKSQKRVYERIYAHRVDTLGKALETKQYFSGIEVDIVFDKFEKRFFVYHPPVKRHGLLLQDFLESLLDKPRLKLWLDWKNASADNSSIALAELTRLDSLFTLRPRSILEVDSVGATKQLSHVADAGWKLSYCIPSDFKNCNSSGDSTRCQQQAEKILKAAKLSKARCLSFDIALWPTVKDFILPRNRMYQLLTWDLSKSADVPNFQKRNIDQFESVIVPVNSKFNY